MARTVKTARQIVASRKNIKLAQIASARKRKGTGKGRVRSTGKGIAKKYRSSMSEKRRMQVNAAGHLAVNLAGAYVGYKIGKKQGLRVGNAYLQSAYRKGNLSTQASSALHTRFAQGAVGQHAFLGAEIGATAAGGALNLITGKSSRKGLARRAGSQTGVALAWTAAGSVGGTVASASYYGGGIKRGADYGMAYGKGLKQGFQTSRARSAAYRRNLRNGAFTSTVSRDYGPRASAQLALPAGNGRNPYVRRRR